MYVIDLLIPTARFVFSVEGERVEVAPEHRSPEAHDLFDAWRAERPVVGMTTFPNTVLLRGDETTILVDPGLHFQNEPVLRALEGRGVPVSAVDRVALTHAHLDHAAACVDVPLPVTVHRRETTAPHWAAVAGVMAERQVDLLEGEEGELAPGIRWAITPGHTAGGVSYCVTTPEGPVVLCGDVIGPSKAGFDHMQAEGPDAPELLTAWRRIRMWEPVRIIAGHVPPFRP
jgi:glyoxylase-like metal-dependent hydrolase (beta-lactamase superfamily II)